MSLQEQLVIDMKEAMKSGRQSEGFNYQDVEGRHKNKEIEKGGTSCAFRQRDVRGYSYCN